MLFWILIIAIFGVIMLGDIIVDIAGEAIWHIGLHTQNLNFMKKRRPERTCFKYR